MNHNEVEVDHDTDVDDVPELCTSSETSDDGLHVMSDDEDPDHEVNEDPSDDAAALESTTNVTDYCSERVDDNADNLKTVDSVITSMIISLA